MVTYDELNTENHKITELTNILTHLLGDRSLCDSEVTCELFYRYVDRVKKHLDTSDFDIYSQLLNNPDQKVRNKADRFMSGSKEIKRIFSSYLKRWCKMSKKELAIKDYDAFMKDTEEMFDIILDRIQDETEHLYPLIREVTGDRLQVA